VGRMHSKLQGLAKPNRLSMPRPAGECPKAISGEPQAGCIAWKDGGGTHGAGVPRVYLEDRELNAGNAWPRAIHRTTFTRQPARGQENGKKTRKRKPNIPEDPGEREGSRKPGRRPIRQALHGAALARARRGRRRPRGDDDEQELAGGQCPWSTVAPQPGILDHHSRFKEKLTAWNCVEVVVGSKLCLL